MSSRYRPRYHHDYHRWSREQRERNRESSDGEYLEKKQLRQGNMVRCTRDEKLIRKKSDRGTAHKDLDDIYDTREISVEKELMHPSPKKKCKQNTFLALTLSGPAIVKQHRVEETQEYDADYSGNEAGNIGRRQDNKQKQRQKDDERLVHKPEDQTNRDTRETPHKSRISTTQRRLQEEAKARNCQSHFEGNHLDTPSDLEMHDQ